MDVVRDLHLRWAERDAAKAVMDGHGHLTRAREVVIDYSMQCEAPGYREESHVGLGRSITVIRKVRCRKCATCLRHKSRYWTARAIAEFAVADATWFGTLTLSPEMHFELDARAELPETRRVRQLDGTIAEKVRPGANLAKLGPDELFHTRCKVLASDVRRWINLVRWHSKARLRYLLVFERHSGKDDPWMANRPHVHILLHEPVRGSVVPVWDYYPALDKRSGRTKVYMADSTLLRSKWGHGFTKFELVTSWRVCAYVVKYMRKAPQGRVRASLKYGMADWTKTSSEGTRVWPEVPAREALTSSRDRASTVAAGKPVPR